MQSPWTRDRKIRAEQVSIAPQVSGSITYLPVHNNQKVKAGEALFHIDDTPYLIAILDATAWPEKAKAGTEQAPAAES